MRWAGGALQYSKQQLVRLLDCETKARRAVVGTASSKQPASTGRRCGRIDYWVHLVAGRGTAASDSLPGHWRRLSIALHSAHIYHHHTVTLYAARRVVDDLHSPPLSSARRLDRAVSGRALLSTQRHGNCQLASKAASHRRLSHVAEIHAASGGYVLAASRLFSLTSGEAWPDTPRRQLCACFLGCLATRKCVVEKPIASLPAFCAGADELGGTACKPASENTPGNQEWCHTPLWAGGCMDGPLQRLKFSTLLVRIRPGAVSNFNGCR